MQKRRCGRDGRGLPCGRRLAGDAKRVNPPDFSGKTGIAEPLCDRLHATITAVRRTCLSCLLIPFPVHAPLLTRIRLQMCIGVDNLELPRSRSRAPACPIWRRSVVGERRGVRKPSLRLGGIKTCVTRRTAFLATLVQNDLASVFNGNREERWGRRSWRYTGRSTDI